MKSSPIKAVLLIIALGIVNPGMSAQSLFGSGFCSAPSFQLAPSTKFGRPAFAIASGDFNGDGKLDVVTANNFPDDISLFLNDGSGNLAQAGNIAAGTKPIAIVATDLNADGKLDIAVANATGGTITVLLGDGQGGFGAPTSFSAGTSPSGIVAGDFNGDGKTDLAVTDQPAGAVRVLPGDGHGAFGAGNTFAVGSLPRAIVAADFNRDGKLDLAAGDNGTNKVSVLLNNGTGFARTDYTVGNGPLSIALSDFNGDSITDLAVVGDRSTIVSVLLGDGLGGFNQSASLDLGGSQNVLTVVTGDFNGDQKTDLAVAIYASGNVVMFLGDGAGQFTSKSGAKVGRGPWPLVSGDFNGDGKTDLVTANNVSQSLSILVGRGDGTFLGAPTFKAGVSPLSVVVGDFNNDGKADVAATNFSFNPSSISVLLNDGNGGLSAPTSFPAGPDPTSPIAADFNADGKLDLAVTNRSAGNISVLLGDGHGNFASPATFSAGAGTSAGIIAADFDGDGKQDLAVANNNSPSSVGTVSILRGNGAGGFASPVSFNSGGANPLAVVAGDFNGDGKTDLVVANGGHSTVSLLIGNGAGNFGAPTNFTVGTSPRAIVVGDFNSDARPDLAVANYGDSSAKSSTVSVMLGNGAGGFNFAPSIVTGPTLQWIAEGDFNGDSKLDLVTTDPSFNLVVQTGDGTGAFSTAVIAVGDFSSPAVGDLNGDGTPDLATISAGYVSLLFTGCGATSSNPIDDTTFFVRQHYVDFLNRQADASGQQFWVNNVESCGTNQQCREVKRIDTSAAFFLSIEFQQTGFLVYRIYKAAFGNLSGKPIPVTRSSFLPDIETIGRGVVVLQSGWEQQLEANKQAFAKVFVQRAQFTQTYPTTQSPTQFVDGLFAHTGITPSGSERQTAINEFGSANTTADIDARARALRDVAENAAFSQAEFNRAFVLMQYFGYLQRDPDSSPDSDFSGYNFWLAKLNQFNGNYINAEMVKAFLSSIEYRQRFGS